MIRRHRRAPPSAQSAISATTSIAELLPPTAQLLVEGGDARIGLDASSAINQYGCPAVPDPDLLAFGSSTASVISARGHAAADRLRQHLQAACAAEEPATLYANELERVRRALCDLYGLGDSATTTAPDIVFATSGTDLHLIAGQLAAHGASRPPLVVMIEAAETGSQVPAALRGNHFGNEPAARTSEGEAIDAIALLEIAAVAVRQPDGRPRPGAEVDAEVESRVACAVAEGRRVLLVVVDVAKSGLLAPSPACAIALARRFPDHLDVMIDACQFRIGAATLRAYLARGFMVAVTGSKFMTGPTFSGALLLPRAVSARWRARPLPATLGEYSTRAEWPAGWGVAGLPDYANFGLLLRWEAALAEMRAFCALPEATVERILAAFADAVGQRLNGDPRFEALPVSPLERHDLVAVPGWDRRQTIFPFLLRRADGGYLSAAEVATVYRGLQQGAAGVRCQLGQPLSCGMRDAQPLAALRLCASARLVVDAAQDAAAEAAVIARAMQALDQVAALIGRLPSH